MSVYAVNGKEPSNCWIPSLDTTGNGTTTLTDFVGTQTGTLTNFALTGSTSNWVADTAAGGVRAIACDGVNDYVVSTNGAARTITKLSISAWIKRDSGQRGYVFATGNNDAFADMGLELYPTVAYLNVVGNAFYGEVAHSADGQWHHYVLRYDGTGTGNAGRFRFWIDGVEQTLTFFGSCAASYTVAAHPAYFGFRPWAASYSKFVFDDIRFFADALDADDVSYLYFAGIGRGRVASPGNSRRRRQSVSGGVL